jgi:hypothetical protein
VCGHRLILTREVRLHSVIKTVLTALACRGTVPGIPETNYLRTWIVLAVA